MKIVWLPNAYEHLNAIYNFYLNKNRDAAVKIYNGILEEVNVLLSFPQVGQLELLLSHHPENFRYLLVQKGKFKVIYEIDETNIYIYNIWDCRQSPDYLISGFL